MESALEGRYVYNPRCKPGVDALPPVPSALEGRDFLPSPHHHIAVIVKIS